MSNNKAREVNNPIIKQLLDETNPEELAKIDNILTRLALTYHAEQTDDYNNIANIMNLFLNFETETE